jgi:hypothetical protein
MIKYNNVIFNDEQFGSKHERNNKNCPAWRCDPEECDCGGLVHNEFLYEECTEDYSDCWDVCDYRCDKCNMEHL